MTFFCQLITNFIISSILVFCILKTDLFGNLFILILSEDIFLFLGISNHLLGNEKIFLLVAFISKISLKIELDFKIISDRKG
jgi:hypothetical protein